MTEKFTQFAKEVSAYIMVSVKNDKLSYSEAVSLARKELLFSPSEFNAGVSHANNILNGTTLIKDIEPSTPQMVYVVMYSLPLNSYTVKKYINRKTLIVELKALGFKSITEKKIFNDENKATLEANRLNNPLEKIESDIIGLKKNIKELEKLKVELFESTMLNRTIHEFFNQAGTEYPDYSRYEHIMPIISKINLMHDYRFSTQIQTIDVTIEDGHNGHYIEITGETVIDKEDTLHKAVLKFIAYCQTNELSYSLDTPK